LANTKTRIAVNNFVFACFLFL